LLLNHHVKKGKLHLHNNCDNGPGPGKLCTIQMEIDESTSNQLCCLQSNQNPFQFLIPVGLVFVHKLN